MNIQQLTDHCVLPIHMLQCPQKDEEILYVIGEDSPFQEYSLCLCNAASVRPDKAAVTECINLLFYGATAEQISSLLFPSYVGKNIFILEKAITFEELQEAIHQTFRCAAHYTQACSQLTASMFSNNGIQSLIDTAFQILDNPIFLTDTLNKYIAYAYDKASLEMNPSFCNFVKDDMETGFISAGGERFIKKENLEQSLAESHGPMVMEHRNFKVETIYNSLHLYNVSAGMIWMAAVKHPFGKVDKQIFLFLSELVAQELRKDITRSLNYYDEKSLFLIDVLSSNYFDEILFNKRKAAFNLQGDIRFLIGSSCSYESTMSSAALNQYMLKLRRILPDWPIAIFNNRVVFLGKMPMRKGLEEELLKELGYIARLNRLQMGLSNPFTDMKNILYYYKQAAIVADYYNDHPAPDIPGCVLFKDSVTDILISSYSRLNIITDLIQPEIRQIHEYDLQNHTDYIPTLQAYFKFMGKPKVVAEHLHIHQNTLLYRLNRMKESFRLDLHNGSKAFQYQLSLYVLEKTGESAGSITFSGSFLKSFQADSESSETSV